MKVAPIQPYVAQLYGVAAPQPPSVPAAAERTAAPQTPQPPQLSAAERELFIRLFPESAPYIAHHVLFTRQGRLHEPDIYKGSLVDIRV
jgi:hypothetical protein